MAIFKVKSNLKLNGAYHTAGGFIEGEPGAFEGLVASGALQPVSAETIEAAEIADAEAKADQEATPEIPPVEPENTWGPKKANQATPGTESGNEPALEPNAPVIEPQSQTAPVVGQGDQPEDGDNL